MDLQVDTAADGSKSYSVFDNRTEKYTSFAYIASSQQLLLFVNGATIVYNASNITQDSATSRTYQIANGTLLLQQPRSDILYVNRTIRTFTGPVPNSVGNATTANEERYLMGSGTLYSDLPASGVSTYSTILDSTPSTPGGTSDFTGGGPLLINFTANTVTSTMTLTGVSGALILTFSGQYTPSTNTLSGQITSNDGSYTGVFYGHLYGPAGVELGLVYQLKRQDGFAVVGSVFGR